MPKKSLITAAQDATGEWQDTQTPQTDPEIAEMLDEAPGENPSDPHTSDDSEEFPTRTPGIQAGDSENPPTPQTDIKSDEFQADGPGLQEAGGENTPVSQTGTESEPDTAEAAGIASGLANNNSSPHTGTEAPDILSGSGFEGSLQPDSTSSPQNETESGVDEGTAGASAVRSDDAAPQTEAESPENMPGSAAQGPLNPDTHTDSQTDSGDADKTGANIKKPRRRTTKSQSGNTAEAAAQPDGEQPANPAPARRRRARTEPVLAIDEERSVETREDKLKSDLLDLVESQKGKRILAGTIQGVERSADNPNITFAVIYHGAFKVIIPAEETVRPPEDFRDRSPADVMHYLVTKRLGAEIDYIVKGVDVKSGIAAASRLEAMALKRREYYFGTDRDGNNLIYEGLSAEARVVSVIRAGMFVDLFGLETYIPLRELSYQRWIDAMAHFQPGQRVLVKILTLDRSDRSNIRVSASVKQAGDNPYEQALRRYTPGSRYVGTVSMVDVSGVFVSLDGGVDCLCTHPKRGRPPRGARVTVRVIGVNHETNRIWGAITHMTTAR